MEKIRFASLCAGCGGIDLGLEAAGMECVYACEIDKYACQLYRQNLNPDVLFEGSLFDINPNTLPDFDLLCAGFPCQPFSTAGERKGFEDPRGNVFFGIARILNARKTPMVLLENVAGLVSHDGGNTLRVILGTLYDMGYALRYEVLNARTHANVPQNRERIFIVGFLDHDAAPRFMFPGPIPLTRSVRDVIDFDEAVDQIFYIKNRDESRKRRMAQRLDEAMDDPNAVYQHRGKEIRKNKSGVIPALIARVGTGGNNEPIIRTRDGSIRKITPRECFNAMGFDRTFDISGVSKGQAYKIAGNSVCVPLITRIGQAITDAVNGTGNPGPRQIDLFEGIGIKK